MKRSTQKPLVNFLSVVGVSSAVAATLLLGRLIATGSLYFWFLPWNLFLGLLPLVFALALTSRLKTTRLIEWQNVALAALWLGFLPNSFYIVSDLIHVYPTGEISQLYDVVLMMSFIWSGFLAGFCSLYLMHQEAFRHFSRRYSHVLVGIALLLCSFAIYLGRYLRWNTWDIVLNPFGLIFDVSERFINPGEHPQAFSTTLIFFVLLSSIYWSVYRLAQILRSTKR